MIPLSPAHMKAGWPAIRLGLRITGIVAALCVVGGIVGIIWNAVSPTEITLFGATVTTGHVGVAFVFIGLVVLAVVVSRAFKTLVDLGKIKDRQ